MSYLALVDLIDNYAQGPNPWQRKIVVQRIERRGMLLRFIEPLLDAYAKDPSKREPLIRELERQYWVRQDMRPIRAKSRPCKTRNAKSYEHRKALVAPEGYAIRGRSIVRTAPANRSETYVPLPGICYHYDGATLCPKSARKRYA